MNPFSLLKKMSLSFKTLALFPLIILGVLPVHSQAPFGGYLSLSNDAYAYRDFPPIVFWPSSGIDFTVEFWVKACPNTGQNSITIGSDEMEFLCKYSCLFVCNNQACYAECGSSFLSILADGNWHHVALTFDVFFSTRIAALYYDGVRLFYSWDGLYDDLDDFSYSNNPFLFSIGDAAVSSATNMQLDEMRITEGILYTDSSFIPPSAPFVADSNTIALWHFDEGQDSTYFYNAAGSGQNLIGVNGAHTNSPPAIFDVNGQQDSILICLGDTIFATGGEVFDWMPNSIFSQPFSSAPSIIVTDTSLWVYVSISDSNLCPQILDSIFVTVNTPPLVDAGIDTTICFGDSILIGSGIQANIAYSWTPTTTLTDSNQAQPLVFPSTSTDYILLVTDTLTGCLNQDTVSVNLYSPVPNANIQTSTNTLCVGESLAVQATQSLGYVYSWSPAGLFSAPNQAVTTTSPLSDTTIFLHVIDANGCEAQDTLSLLVHLLPIVSTSADTSICAGDSIALTASGGTSYLWTPTIGLSSPSSPTPLASPSSTQQYTVAVTDLNGCIGNDSILVDVNPLPVLTTSPDSGICLGDSIQLQVINPSIQSFQWTPDSSLDDPSILQPIASPTETTSYFIQVSDSLGCAVSDSILVTVYPLPNIQSSSDTSICLGDSIMLLAQGGLSYVWTPSGSLDSSTSASPFAFPLQSTNFSVIGTDSNGCVNEDSTFIEVFNFPQVILVQDTIICAGDSMQLFATSLASSYQWQPMSSLSDPTISDPIAFPSQTTLYELTVTDNASCEWKDSVTVFVSPLPQVDAGPDLDICLGDSVQLQASGAVQYVWSPGAPLSDSSIAAPFAMPIQSTEFILWGIGNTGCMQADSMLLTVDSDTVIAGQLMQSNGDPMVNSAVLLVEYTPIDSSISASDTAYSDTLGKFVFTVSSGIYYLKSIPDSAQYPLEIPSYFSSSTTIQAADSLILACDTTLLSIVSIAGQNPGGPGFIAGNIYQGAGKSTEDPIPNLAILLYSNGQAYQHTYTDSLGYFQFDQLEIGTYQVWTDYLFIDNGLAPSIFITNDEPIQDSLIFQLTTSQLIRESLTTDLTEINSPIDAILYPNPSSSSGTLRYELSFSQTANITLFDSRGRLIWSHEEEDRPGLHEVRIQAPASEGVYHVRMQLAGGKSWSTNWVIFR